MIKQLTLIALLAVTVFTSHAQYITNYRKAGDLYYAKGDYYSASKYYEKYLAGESPVQKSYMPYLVQKQGTRIVNAEKLPGELVYQMADSYFQLGDYDQAINWYRMLMDKFPGMYPQALYWYALCLRAKGDYMSAMEKLETFVVKYPIKDKYSEGAQHELDVCLFIRRQLSNPTPGITVQKLNKINLQKDSASYTPNGLRMFFTEDILDKEGKKQMAVYYREKKNDSWSEPSLAEGEINLEGYSSCQPQVTSDGRFLIFASDRKGGVGGYDLWYALLDSNGKAGAVVNMGPTINTLADEAAPFHHAASNTLVFASKGWLGMGGFDLFSSTGSFTTGWKQATNLGYPVNSTRDETWFLCKGDLLYDNAIICSDRLSSCCLEIFSVNKSEGKDVAAGK